MRCFLASRGFGFRTLSAALTILLGLQIAAVAFPLFRAQASSGSSVQQTAVSLLTHYEGIDVHTVDALFLCGCASGQLSIEPEVAASPAKVMEVDQGVGQVFDKQLQSYLPFPMTRVLSSDGSTCDGIGDTRVLFDPSAGTNGRWFVAAIHDITTGCPGSSHFLRHEADVAVSPGNDPSVQNWGDYHAITAPIGANFNVSGVDHPYIAVTSDKLVLVTQFPLNVLVYNKADLVNLVSNPVPQNLTSNILQQEQQGCYGSEPYPVRNIGYTTRQYMICQSGNSFFLFYLDGTPPNSTVSGWTNLAAVQSPRCCTSGTLPDNTKNRPYALAPIAAPITALSGYVSFSELISAVWSNNQLWFATTVSCSPGGVQQNCISLTKAYAYTPPNTTPPSVNATLSLNQTSTDFFLPTLSIDSQGDLALIFGYSSATIYPSLGVTGQAPGDPPGSLAPWKSLQVQGAGYDWVDLGNRYSDFFGAATDPSDPTLVWVAGQYYPTVTCVTSQSGTTPCWATWVTAVRVVGLQLWSNPNVLNVDSGYIGSASVNVVARAGLGAGSSGSVTLSTAITPSGPTATLSQTSVTLSLGSTGTVTDTVNATTVPAGGAYNLTVTAQTPDLLLTLSIPVYTFSFDFSMSTSPSNLSIQPEFCCYVSASTTLTLTLLVGIYGPPVTFTTQGQPSYMQVSYSPTSAAPSASVTVTFTIPAGGKIYTTHTYNVVITGKGAGVTHTTTVAITVYFDCTRSGCFDKPAP